MFFHNFRITWQLSQNSTVRSGNWHWMNLALPSNSLSCLFLDPFLVGSNPFHNFEHASHVTQSVTKLMSRIVAPDTIDYDELCYKNKGKASTLHDHTYGIVSHWNLLLLSTRRVPAAAASESALSNTFLPSSFGMSYCRRLIRWLSSHVHFRQWFTTPIIQASRMFNW